MTVEETSLYDLRDIKDNKIDDLMLNSMIKNMYTLRMDKLPFPIQGCPKVYAHMEDVGKIKSIYVQYLVKYCKLPPQMNKVQKLCEGAYYIINIVNDNYMSLTFSFDQRVFMHVNIADVLQYVDSTCIIKPKNRFGMTVQDAVSVVDLPKKHPNSVVRFIINCNPGLNMETLEFTETFVQIDDLRVDILQNGKIDLDFPGTHGYIFTNGRPNQYIGCIFEKVQDSVQAYLVQTSNTKLKVGLRDRLNTYDMFDYVLQQTYSDSQKDRYPLMKQEIKDFYDEVESETIRYFAQREGE